jgi:3,4-dehydroadipyl-CoA semialdehyde dehydrogenase
VTDLLPNYVSGAWLCGAGDGTELRDPVTGAALVRVSSSGLDLPGALAFARNNAGPALRALTYGERAAILGRVTKVLQANRDAYLDISVANSGTTRMDSAIDVDGAIYTLGQYARWGGELGDARVLADGGRKKLGKAGSFESLHVYRPTRGLALLINAFNFPGWGLWEKAAPALLSGVPVVVKPATATAWLAQRMVADVVAAELLPPGALSVVCGRSEDLLDALEPFDVVSFTGSAATALRIRRHSAVASRSVRVNVEADSLNSALLMTGEGADTQSFALLAREVVREMTIKSGQRCTAIRRVFVPEGLFDAAAQTISASLASVTVGNPRNGTVRMGALVSRAQLEAVKGALGQLRTETEVLHDGSSHELVDADPGVAACLGPTLLGAREPIRAPLVHRVEAFGPVCTLLPYRDIGQATDLIRRGEGSLVVSIYGSDPAALAAVAVDLADSHGRVHVVSPSVADSHTGHGNVMPHSVHGGPGRAGGGEEVGGLRALTFYHRRTAIQADTSIIDQLGTRSLIP